MPGDRLSVLMSGVDFKLISSTNLMSFENLHVYLEEHSPTDATGSITVERGGHGRAKAGAPGGGGR